MNGACLVIRPPRDALSRILSISVLIITITSLVWIGARLSPQEIPADASPHAGAEGGAGIQNDQLMQFTSGKHVLGFQSSQALLAGGDHMLRVNFVGANPVSPVSDQPSSSDGHTQPLTRVTYPHLWSSISLVYESAPGGVIKSSYSLEPGARVGDIALEYNKPAQITVDGNLHFSYKTGEMVEDAPVAWQEIDGQRIPVEVFFTQKSEFVIGFGLGDYNPGYSLVIDPVIRWNTFLGDHMHDRGNGIVYYLNNREIFVTGTSEASWGSPRRAHSGGEDAFVAGLNKDGELMWNTFLGGSEDDEGMSIAINRSAAELYVIGESAASWGSPVRAYQGGYDAFVAKLDRSDGNLDWHTFLGSSGNDHGMGITFSFPILAVTGFSGASWGAPERAYSGLYDAFVARLDYLHGSLTWNTFLGSSANDRGMSIITNGSDIYSIGYSYNTWGSPYRAHSGLNDAFVAGLDEDGELSWNTFLGSGSNDYGQDIALDDEGNIYVVGTSNAHWQGTFPPVRAYSGGADAFVAKFSAFGLLYWNTFLGSSGSDRGYGIVVRSHDYVYLTGGSDNIWGAPVLAHSGGDDAYVARLSTAGALQFNTFLGSNRDDLGNEIALNVNGEPIVTGESLASWNIPVRECEGYDAFAAQITTGGTAVWNTFLGAASDDDGRAIALDSNGNIYVAGYSRGSWGIPTRAHSGKYDAFVAKLNQRGYKVWNTFLGCAEDDKGYGIALNSSGDVYVTGDSTGTWGTPKRAYSGLQDAFVAKLNSNGTLLWNTFLGSTSNDTGYDVDLFSGGNFNVTGVSYATWGTPRRGFTSRSDAFVAEIDSSGNLIWNTFLGSSGFDAGRGLVVDNLGDVFITGYSSYTWGSPIRSHSGTGVYNAFVAKLDSSGYLDWNTFLGSMGDRGYGIDRDNAGNLYVTGETYQGWGFPIRGCTANYDAFVAKLNSAGASVWNTCLGMNDGLTYDGGYGITSDSIGNSFVTGVSGGTWGSPDHPYSGKDDVFLARLDASGNLVWNTFQGSYGDDEGYGIVLGDGSTVFATGTALGSFGNPINPSHGDDAFVVAVGSPVWLPLVLKH